MAILKKIYCLVFFIALSACCFQSAADAAQDSSSNKESLYVGVLANLGKIECFDRWHATASYLNTKLPAFKIQIVCLDFDEVDRAVENRHVDFTVTNPSMYVGLEHTFGASRISTLINKQSQQSYTKFGGVIFCRADRTDLKSIKDLKGRSFMAVAENSFGGWLISWRYLKDRGVNPYTEFKNLLFGGRHDAVVMSVANGTVDAGCVRTDILERMALNGEIELKDFYIFPPAESTPGFSLLRTTRLYPEWPLAKMQHTSEDTAKQVALAMMQMPADGIAAQSSHAKGWTIPLDYHEVHACLRELLVSPYADYGVITPKQLYDQYKHWIQSGIVFLGCLVVGVTLILKLNWKLSATLADLDKEHREREQVMADLNEFKMTLDQTLDCVFMFSSDNLHFIYANQGALDHVGYSREELLSMTPLEIKPEFTESQFRSLVAPLIEKSGHSLTFITKHQRKDGTLIPVEIFLQHIVPPQKVGRFVAIVRDITLRLEEQAEKDLLRNRLLQEQKMASVGQLAAGIAHEINTPAQYLGSNISFLQEAFADVSTLIGHFEKILIALETQQEMKPQVTALKEIQDEVDWPYLKEEIPQAIMQSIDGVKQVSSIVLAMKNFAHPGSTEKEMTDLNELLETTLTVSRNEWKYWVEPTLDLDRQLPRILCMRNEIAQVFLNIIVNAAHAIAESLGDNPEGQKGRMVLSSKLEAKSVVIKVSDSGSGISEENLSQIFDPFFTTKEVGKGTGQGLTIAYDIITNKHGGTLDVTSELGVGTTFVITLLLEPSSDHDRGEIQDV